MSAPNPPARLAYGVTMASHQRGAGIVINCVEYAQAEDARRWFACCMNDPAILAATLEGPDGEVLAEYDATTRTLTHSED